MNRYDFFAFVDCAVIFSAFTISIYHLMIFMGRWRQKEERGNLFLPLFTFSLGCYVFMISLWGEKLFHVTYLLFPVTEGIVLFILLFSLSRLMDQIIGENNNRIFRIVVFSLLGLTLISALIPFRQPENFRIVDHYRKYWRFPLTIIYLAASVGIFVQLIITVIKKKQYKRPEVILALTGLMLILFYLMTKRLLAIKSYSRFFYNPTVIIGTLLLAYAQARRFNRENRELRVLQNELEHEVEIRTKELEEARDETARLNEQKTKMFINLAHETRTPLTLIRFHLEKNKDRWEKVPGFRPILRNINRLQRDMVNFLDSEKLMRGEILYRHDTIVNFSELLEEKRDFFYDFCKAKGLEIDSDIEPDCLIKADPFALDRILNNLLMNAVKFTSSGSITLTLKKKESGKEKNPLLEFILKDTGRGIDENLQNELFLPYVHAAETKENIQGYGMGLYITSNLIKEIGGTLTVSGEEGVGSEFKMEFPATDRLKETLSTINEKEENLKEENTLRPFFEAQTVVEIADDMSEDIIQKEPETKNRQTILIVEDNTELLSILTKELSEDYSIISAESGNRAIEKLKTSPVPHLILSDIMMDNGDGFDLYRQISANPAYQAVPFIFLSAVSEPNEKLRAFQSGVVEFVQKPFSMEELKARISALLRLSDKKKAKVLQEAVGILNNFIDNPSVDPEEEKRIIFERRCRELELSTRQQEIASMVAQGLEHKEISANLNISQRTVIRHLQNIYEKLQVHNKVEMINRLYSP